MKRLNARQRDTLDGYLFTMLPVLGVIIFVGLPLIVSLFLSFSHLDSFDLFEAKFVGLDNYIKIFTSDKKFLGAIGSSFLYAIATSLLQTALALVLAYFLSKQIKLAKVFRIILFIPYVCSVAVLSIVWKWLLDGNFGILNDILIKLGGEPIDWLKNPNTSMLMMIIMSVWSGLGYGTILYTAALSSVNKAIYEASMMDGANGFQRFFRITLPQISNTTFYLLVMGMIGNLQAFANFQIMKPLGPNGQIETLVYRVWFTAFEADFTTYGIGYSSALGWLSGLIIILFTIIMFRMQKKWVHYES